MIGVRAGWLVGVAGDAAGASGLLAVNLGIELVGS